MSVAALTESVSGMAASLAALPAAIGDADETLRAAAQELIDTARGLLQQISQAPTEHGEAMAVHLYRLAAWRVHLQEDASGYTAALAEWGGAGTGPGAALVAAGADVLADIAALDERLEEYDVAANEVQAAGAVVDAAAAELAGAQDVLDALNASDSTRAALTKATAEFTVVAANARRMQQGRAAQAAAIYGMRRRRAAMIG